MIPATKWLNATTDKIFLLDYDKFSLFRVVERPGKSGDREFNIHQINSCPISLPTAKQDQDAVRSFALDKSADNYLAIGFTSGRINIFQADIDASIKFIRGEEIREVQKSITNLEWNYFDSNRLCAAYERGRGPDHTVVVYDLNRTLRNSRELPVSIFETNFTEKVFGISWFKEDPNLLLISGTRGIRITDIREHGNFQSTLIVQNPLMGVCSEPTHGYLFACHSRNNIFVYDRRFLTFSPLQEIEACASHKIISKLSWHPKRHFHLSAVAKDSGNFYHFSISANAFRQHNQNAEPTAFHHRQTDARNETPEYSYASQIYSVHGVQKLGSFDWHPLIADRVALMPSASHVGRMAASTLPNAASRDLVILSIRGDICSDISCNGEFAHAAAQQLKIDNRRLMEVDKTRIYRTRLETGYGYGNTLSPLPTLIENSRKAIEEDLYADQDLSFCWQWIWAMYQAADASEVQKAYGTMFVGIKHILKGTKSFSTFKQDEVTFRNRIFVNDRRLKILRMCNWPNYSDRDDCKAKFDELASRRGVHGLTRAAALALFSVQGPLSKEYLVQLNEFVNSREFVDSGQGTEFVASYQKMANIVLNIMQKYDGVRVAEYDTIVGEDYIQDHYLLTIVKFLARRDKGYNKIHNEIFESDIDLQDKLAFAALHMDDEYLSAALNNLSKELILARRPLSVLLIVGLEDQPETHQVLHHFLDLTEDIQTATILLIIGNCFRKCLAMQDLTLVGTKPSELLDRAIDLESRANPRRRSLKCARDYMELLNHWRLWLPKAFLCTFLRPKVQFSDLDARSRIMNTQAVIACTYCGSPIYPSTIEKIENLRTPKIGPYPGRRVGTSSRTRAISCICRKPLPKCIICRKHLGSQVEPGMEEATSKTSVIDHWFVWCSNCNHGGHLAHIRDWFSEYPVCASAGCNCLCLHRDDQLREELYSSSTTNDGQTTAEDL